MMMIIMTKAVMAPERFVRSEEVSRLIGILSIVMLVRTPVQNGARYHTAASKGAFRNAGRVKRNAKRQNAYATNNAGRNIPKAVSSGGGVSCGCEKSDTCQNPMHTRHQYRTTGFGRRTMNKRQVMRILNARAGVRRSSQ